MAAEAEEMVTEEVADDELPPVVVITRSKADVWSDISS